MVLMFFLPLADFKTIKAPAPEAPPVTLDDLLARASENAGLLLILGSALAVTVLGLWLWARVVAKPPLPAPRLPWILIDGSNVMHWQDNKPLLAPLLRVVERLKVLGYAPGMVFDANVGWKLFGRYMDDDELALLLTLPRAHVFVVPKGKQADPYLLDTARAFGARIVTNDRFRDWAETYPEVQNQGFLVRGGMRDGQLWLQQMDAAAVKSGAQ